MWVRVAPFLIFVGLTALQGRVGEGSEYWIYLLKTIVGAAMVVFMWPLVAEMRWNVSWAAVAVGVLVFVIWVGLDPFYPKWGGGSAVWNPHDHFGSGAAMAWFFIAVRVIGVTLVVPPIEEVFYRSFLYRYIVQPDFQKVSFGHFAWLPLLATAGLFGFAHFEWLAGLLAGLAYQGLVLWKKRLGDAIVAHAITNLLLAVWVNAMGMWFFW